MLTAGPRDGPALVLLHGFLGDPEEWRPVIDRLPSGWRCLAPPLPGHDGQPPSASDFQELALELEHRLAAYVPPRFALVGYSLGGRLALGLASRAPHRLTGLVLEGAHPGLADTRSREQRRRHDEAWAAHLETAPWRESLDAWYRQPVFADLGDAERQQLIERRCAHEPSHLATTLRAASLAGQPDLRPALRSVPAPRGIIVGTRDRKFRELATTLAELDPGLTVAKLEGVGHNCHLAAPERVAAEIQAILSDEHGNP